MTGEKISRQMGRISVPEFPVAPFTEGDGTEVFRVWLHPHRTYVSIHPGP